MNLENNVSNEQANALIISKMNERQVELMAQRLEKQNPSILANYAKVMKSFFDRKDVQFVENTTAILATIGFCAMGAHHGTVGEHLALFSFNAPLLVAQYSGVLARMASDSGYKKEAQQHLNEIKDLSVARDVELLGRIAELQPTNQLVSEYRQYLQTSNGKNLDSFLANRSENMECQWRDEADLKRQEEVLRYIQKDFPLAAAVLEENKPFDKFLIDRMERRNQLTSAAAPIKPRGITPKPI